MNKKIVRILALILCAVMLLGMIPLIALADEIQPRSIGTTDWGYSFDTFAELKELVAGDHSGEQLYLTYTGAGDLVIEEDLVIPENLELEAWDVSLVIPEGVTLRCGWFGGDRIVIDGTVEATSVTARDLTVNGKLYVEFVNMPGPPKLAGAENIVFPAEWGDIYIWYDVFNMDELYAAIDAIRSSDIPRSVYGIDLYGVEITESATLPQNCELYVYAPVTVAEGATLTVDGAVYLHSELAVLGGLDVENLMVFCQDGDGQLTVAQGGNVDFQWIQVQASDEEAFRAALAGLDLSGCNVQEYPDEYLNWVVQYLGDLVQLPVPTELCWGYEAVWYWDEATDTYYAVKQEGPASSICWKVDGNAVANYRLYRVGGDSDELVYEGWSSAISEEGGYDSVDLSQLTTLESGTYYFTVSLSSYDENGNYAGYSETAVSDTWTYEAPNSELGTCTDLYWQEDTHTACWTGISDREYLKQYYVEYYFAESMDAEAWLCATAYTKEDSVALWEESIGFYGEGYYSFKVRALSTDTGAVGHGEWSEMSPAMYIGAAQAVPGDVDGDGVLNDADVAQLLWHTLFPETYAVSGDADFTGDGLVDDQDVAYLLWHTLFPDKYPI